MKYVFVIVTSLVTFVVGEKVGRERMAKRMSTGFAESYYSAWPEGDMRDDVHAWMENKLDTRTFDEFMDEMMQKYP